MNRQNHIRVIRVIRGSLLPLLIAAGMPLLQQPAALAQCTFSSGSTGTDGAFTPTNSMPGTGWSFSNDVATGKGIVTVTNKSNGIFNFTSIYIETNWVVKFTRNSLNTPTFLLATTNVTIKGTIDVKGGDGTASPTYSGGAGGPGGFDGGMGVSGGDYGNGFGPGGGVDGWGAGFRENGEGAGGGLAYGTIDVQLFIGGSGGAGWPSGNFGGGGGGGEALLIASTTIIDVTGSVVADAGAAAGSSPGRGSGGAIRLIADTIQGEGPVSAQSIGSGFPGRAGRIRLEACNNRRLTLTFPPATFGPPGAVFLSTNPTIRVASIAGTNTPAIPAGSLAVPDVYLPTNFVNPAVIEVTASNVNVGTSFKVIVIPSYGTNLIGSNTLVGTYAFSSNTVTVSVYTDRVWRVNALIDYIQRP